MWAEAIGEVEKGWLSQPIPVNEQGSCIFFKGSGVDVAFKFAVLLVGKIRAFDDMRHSITNRARAVLTPIKLVSWDHVAHISNLLAKRGFGCQFPKDDHRAAYKSLPVCPSQTKLAAIVLKNPGGGNWYAFTSRTLLFGSIASVLHYNIFPRAISELVAKIFGILIVCFFDDFGALIIKCLAIEGLWCFQQFCDICGIDLKPRKPKLAKK